MDPHYFPTTERPSSPPRPPLQQSKKQNQIQGPRPAALKVNQDSRKVKKPPLPPPPRQPVIIYAVSPRIIHTEVSDFMAVVQRLTGLSSGDFSSDGQVSPAARLAATEKASPRDQKSNSNNNNADDVSDVMNFVEGLEIGQIPGILSPAPAMLPPVPSGFFSPVTDPNLFSDIINCPYANSGFVVSPSGLLSTSMLSPLPSPDVFHLLMDF